MGTQKVGKRMQTEPVWVKVALDVELEQLELASALLWGEGASGVEEQDATTMMEGRAPLGEGRGRAIAFFGGEAPEVVSARLGGAAASWGLEGVGIEAEVFTDETWKERWKQFFKPVRISERLAVRPPWEQGAWPEGVREVVIEPGLAFGTGTHATTQLCLGWIDDLCAERRYGSMLDVGCGSGILAIGAALMDSEMRVGALDVDPEALRVCRENFELNGVEGRIELLGPLLSEVEGRYGLVVANILSNVLIMLGPELLRCVEEGGRLLLSGIGDGSASEVEAAFKDLGVEVVARRNQEGWTALLMERAARGAV